ncbi:aspartate carbamoyltransferase regulatory subunit [Peptoclostridium litorale DSM 5388]|uniref:Aspartate carbamoyltransferase regulatory chain n=1 Tax=Peptoclostridium litorale DSM 5388 TaxID=1121324 RepID=A0A069RIU7_PEPLI|nr:aspartate carbamoyltransferase regulatory subunit [Peptoclostridium litorale]KDR96060.1 aspartate carbamoyltransferase regulatory chain [Peptoclostridium litorale DSM 5388]SIO05595.1 aspartate carbamoyltransferase regulatory subunit [Peptoclostridium litorale DSM 5388]
MLTVEGIKNGIVIDHIKAGRGIEVFNLLNLADADFHVALIINAQSKKMGKKDIIKIENVIDIDLDQIGIFDPQITINVIEDEKLSKKIHLELPNRVKNTIRCINPRCITSIETYVENEFELIDEEKGEYKCIYCDDIYKIEK